MRVSGTSVPTETCGQSMPLKFRITFWEYWIWSEVTLSWRGWVTAEGGVTKNTGAGPWAVSAGAAGRRRARRPPGAGEGGRAGPVREEAPSAVGPGVRAVA